jgi:glycosyltransferase involved in cell wall biosynthesis
MKIQIRTQFYAYSSEAPMFKYLAREWLALGHQIFISNFERGNIPPAAKDEIHKDNPDLIPLLYNGDGSGMDVYFDLYDLYNVNVNSKANLKSGIFVWSLLPITQRHTDIVTAHRAPVFISGTHVYNDFIKYATCFNYIGGVDRSIFTEKGETIKELDKYASKFLWVGNATPAPCPDIVIEAFTKAFRKKDNVVLIMIDSRGTVGHLSKIIDNSEDRPDIKVVSGGISPKRIAMYMRSCTALVLPVRFHCECKPILESMSCGLPVITTRYAGPVDYIVNSTITIPFTITQMQDDLKWMYEKYGTSIESTVFCLDMQDQPFVWAHNNIEQLEEILKKIHKRDYDLHMMSKDGIAKANTLSWKISAGKLINVIERTL